MSERDKITTQINIKCTQHMQNVVIAMEKETLPLVEFQVKSSYG